MIKIFIDQGHNPQGVNAGAEGNGLREQDIVYDVGVNLAELLNGTPGYEALLSRPSPDTALGTTNNESLSERVRKASAWGADYFISIHANAAENPDANGTETFVYSFSSASYPLAKNIQAEIVSMLGTRDLGVKERPSLFVLRKTSMPALLVELAFITNPQDAELLDNSRYRFAYAIYRGILKTFS